MVKTERPVLLAEVRAQRGRGLAHAREGVPQGEGLPLEHQRGRGR